MSISRGLNTSVIDQAADMLTKQGVLVQVGKIVLQ